MTRASDGAALDSPPEVEVLGSRVEGRSSLLRIANYPPITDGPQAMAGRSVVPDTSVLYCDDSLHRIAQLPDQCIDLIYLDPPYFRSGAYQVVWGDEAEVRSFKHLLKGGIEHYVGWMRERLEGLHRVLKPTGSLYLHCDPSASHYLKVELDEIFGMGNFRNEIIWKRTTAHNSAKKYAPVHDTILYYVKSPRATWNPPRLPYDTEYLERYYKFDDGDGRLYWRADLCASGTRTGSSGQPWRGLDPASKGLHWRFKLERLDELDAEGRIYWPPGGTGWPQYKRYRDELKGRAVSDIWTDVNRINPKGNERVGYPTQKPEALLERIIEASSQRGQVVLDPFCGCGTTIAVAHRLRRRWIGIDISLTAVEVMKRRMEQREGVSGVRIEGLPETEDDLRLLEPLEFQNWVIRRIHGTHAKRKTGDMGIDGYSFFERLPIQIKQSDRVGRNVVDNFETAIRRDGNDRGYIIAFSFTRGAYEEVARAKRDGLEIALVEIGAILEDPERRRREPRNQMLDDLRRGVLVARQSTTPVEPPPHTTDDLVRSASVEVMG